MGKPMEAFKSRYLFKLNNNLFNRLFLWVVKKKLNKSSFYLIRRGRHPNRKELFKTINKKYSKEGRNEVPIKYAKTIAIYLMRRKS